MHLNSVPAGRTLGRCARLRRQRRLHLIVQGSDRGKYGGDLLGELCRAGY
jgi:hypothetical protein